MLSLYSQRLHLIALSYKQLNILLQDRHVLEQSLGLALSDFELNASDSFVKELPESIQNYVIPKVVEHPDTIEWYTHWLIVETTINLVIGGIGAAGPPDENGQVMIGYYIDRKFENRGFATEAVQCLTDWIFEHPDTITVIADTLVDNIPSQKVLHKAGFVLAGETEEGLRWQLIR